LDKRGNPYKDKLQPQMKLETKKGGGFEITAGGDGVVTKEKKSRQVGNHSKPSGKKCKKASLPDHHAVAERIKKAEKWERPRFKERAPKAEKKMPDLSLRKVRKASRQTSTR